MDRYLLTQTKGNSYSVLWSILRIIQIDSLLDISEDRFLYLEFVSLYVIHQQFNIYSPKKDGFQGTFSTDLMITLYQDKILDIVGIIFKNYL